MCGPISAGVASLGRDTTPFEKIKNVLEYQVGRAVAYAIFGLLSGWLGTVLDTGIFPYANFITAIFFVVFGLRRFQKKTNQPSTTLSNWITKIFRFVRGKSPFIIGFALAIMPCSITIWALGLAANSGDPMTGMWTMLSLVLITSPILLLTGSASALGNKLGNDKIIGVLLIVSGLWIAAKPLAELGLIGHVSFYFRLFDEPYGVMFF